MKYILRLKAVSQCYGIRRATLTYIDLNDGVYSLTCLEHPLNKFKDIIIKDKTITILEENKDLRLGEDIFFYKDNIVKTPTGNTKETLALGVMLFPLDKGMESYYLDAIEKGQKFDQWNGEIEYLLSMMYELDLNDLDKAKEYYDKAQKKGFNYSLYTKIN